jgi:hypothetical protein
VEWNTVEGGVCRGVDGSDISDGLGCALVTSGLELPFTLCPVGILVDLSGLIAIHDYKCAITTH